MDERGRPDHDDKGILDTVRRILSEDQSRGPDAAGDHHDARAPIVPPNPEHDDVLELEPNMMVEAAPIPMSRQTEPDGHLVGERSEQTARQSLGSLRNVIRDQKAVLTTRSGPTIEDIVRDEMRPLLRDWLDAHLPKLVEQVVRAEIARIVERDGA